MMRVPLVPAVVLVAAAAAGAQSDPVTDVEAKLLAYKTGEARAMLADASAEAAARDARLALALGLVLTQEKKLDDAVAQLKKATQLAPADPAAHLALGEALLAKKSGDATAAFTQAAKTAEVATATQAGDARAWLALGVARQRLKKYDEAVAALQKAVELAPGDAVPRYQLGVTRAFQGRWTEAVDALSQAVERNSGLAYAYYYRGLSYDKLKRKDQLVNDMNRFLAIAPGAPDAEKAKAILAAATR